MDELVGRTFHAVFVPLSSSTLLIYHLFRHCERWPHFDGGENKACTMRRVDGALHGATLKGAKIWGDVAGIDTFLKWIVARVQQVWVCYSLQKRKRPSTCFPHPCVRGWGKPILSCFLMFESDAALLAVLLNTLLLLARLARCVVIRTGGQKRTKVQFVPDAGGAVDAPMRSRCSNALL